MHNVPPNPPRPGFPASPCINVCTLDGRNVCVGCKRTIQEIIDWSTMTAEQQWKVVNALPDRRR
ncbi:MAG: DUF1289 domain-containing protein [Woeseiaceae bacterium]